MVKKSCKCKCSNRKWRTTEEYEADKRRYASEMAEIKAKEDKLISKFKKKHGK